MGNDPINSTDPEGRYPRDQHKFITFLLAALLGHADAAAIGHYAGKADNFRYATTGLFGVGVFVNFSLHFGNPPGTIDPSWTAKEKGFTAHTIADNSDGGPHQIVPGRGWFRRVLSALAHIGLNLIGRSPDRDPDRQKGWENLWVALGGQKGKFPREAIEFITGTLNKNGLQIVAMVIIWGDGRAAALGSIDLRNATGISLVASKRANGLVINVWQIHYRSFYDDPTVEEIMRHYSYPGSNPVDEAYAVYQYQLLSTGFHPGVGGWGSFESWFLGLGR